MWRMFSEELEIEALRPPGLGDNQWGMLLCTLGLMQIFTASDTIRDGTTLRYFLDGKLRAVAQTDPNNPNLPHGPFTVYYKDGKSLWITGEYFQGKPRHETWAIYLPDGARADLINEGLQ